MTFWSPKMWYFYGNQWRIQSCLKGGEGVIKHIFQPGFLFLFFNQNTIFQLLFCQFLIASRQACEPRCLKTLGMYWQCFWNSQCPIPLLDQSVARQVGLDFSFFWLDKNSYAFLYFADNHRLGLFK